MIGWILIVPLALSPFILESPNLHRNLLSIFPLLLVVGLGIISFLEILKKYKNLYKLSAICIFILYVGSISYFLYQLFIQQPVYRPWERNHPSRELMFTLKKLENNYNKIIVTSKDSNSYMFFLFFNKFSPKEYQLMGSRGNEKHSEIGKYTFVYAACPLLAKELPTEKIDIEKDTLYVNDGTCKLPLKNTRVVKKIYWGDGSIAFWLLEYQQ